MGQSATKARKYAGNAQRLNVTEKSTFCETGDTLKSEDIV